MHQPNLKSAYLHSALRRFGYTFAEAIAAPPIRAVLEARARAAERRAKIAAAQQELAL